MADRPIGRAGWTIVTPRAKLLSAAKAKVAFHQKRVKYWLSQREKAEKKVRKSGIKIVPNRFDARNISVAASSGYSNTKREVATVNEDLIQEVFNCNRKVEEHKERVRVYQRYVQFLSNTTVGSGLELTIDDAEFFGLIRGGDQH